MGRPVALCRLSIATVFPMRLVTAVLLSVAIIAPAFPQDGAQQFASLGNFKTEQGAVIRDLKLGYRTYGKLNAARSNSVLFPTWFTGTTKGLADWIGPGNLADTKRWFVIAVDAIGDGVSSSPSNSTAQPRMRFPQFTIGDMVEAEYQLATRALHLTHLRAVMGISMGGMQTFEWSVAHPTFMDRLVPIVGSPQLDATDLLLWTSEEHTIEEDRDWNGGNYTSQPPLRALADIHAFALTTPKYRAEQTPRKDFASFLAQTEQNGPERFDANNWLRQLQAMMADNVARHFGGSLERAAAQVKARMLAVVSVQDHMVNPLPAMRFAPLAHARVLQLTGDCGHLAPGCERDRMVPAVQAFLAQ